MDAKSLALRLLLTVPTLGSLPGGRLLPAVSQPLYAVGASAALPARVGLGVVEVPPPPPDVVGRSTPVGPECPVEVRAIITGDAAAETFAVVAVGEASALLKVGQGVRTAAGWVAISAIDKARVVVRKGDEAFDCYLGAAAGDALQGAGEPVR
ncbi:MAG: hypothetical protein HY903_12380 [Deltaproteobacteria bacterium]|nr:hypothetical protein [Deltaproteobacteria bacterium]